MSIGATARLIAARMARDELVKDGTASPLPLVAAVPVAPGSVRAARCAHGCAAPAKLLPPGR